MISPYSDRIDFAVRETCWSPFCKIENELINKTGICIIIIHYIMFIII